MDQHDDLENITYRDLLRSMQLKLKDGFNWQKKQWIGTKRNTTNRRKHFRGTLLTNIQLKKEKGFCTNKYHIDVVKDGEMYNESVNKENKRPLELKLKMRQ